MSDTASIDDWMGRALNVNIDRSGRSPNIAEFGSDDDATTDPANMPAAAPTPSSTDDAPDDDGSNGAGAARDVDGDTSDEPGTPMVPAVADTAGSASPVEADFSNANAGSSDSEQEDDPNSCPSDPSKLRCDPPKEEDGGMTPDPGAKTKNWGLSPALTASVTLGVGVIETIMVLKNLDNGCTCNLSFKGVGVGMAEKVLTIAETEFTSFTTSDPVGFADFDVKGTVKFVGGGIGVGGSVVLVSFWGLGTSPEWINIGGLEVGLPDVGAGAFAGHFAPGRISTS
jgi:hypothetical protein